MNPPEQQPSKPKILLYGDYCCATGFAQVLGNIGRELAASEKYDIDVLAINHSGDPSDPAMWPGRVFPAMPGTLMGDPRYNDPYGRQRLIELLGSGEYDAVFMLQDHFVLQPVMAAIVETQKQLRQYKEVKNLKTVFYFPVDSTLKKDWVTDVIEHVDFPVTYTEFGRKEVAQWASKDLTERLEVIYHGTNPQDFHYVEDREMIKVFRETFFNHKADGRFLLVNVNRNQPRKDIARTLMVLKRLKEMGKNPLLYLHMQHNDAGGNILVMADQLGLVLEEDFIMPHPQIFSANKGLPLSQVNLIYNAADAVITTTLGEGWGLSLTEAMATRTPVIAPDHTAISEILADTRGILVPAGENPGLYIMKENDNERIRPLMDVQIAAEAVAGLMDGTVTTALEAAEAWTKLFPWDKITERWMGIIDEAVEASRSQPKTANTQSFSMTRQQKRAAARKAK